MTDDEADQIALDRLSWLFKPKSIPEIIRRTSGPESDICPGERYIDLIKSGRIEELLMALRKWENGMWSTA